MLQLKSTSPLFLPEDALSVMESRASFLCILILWEKRYLSMYNSRIQETPTQVSLWLSWILFQSTSYIFLLQQSSSSWESKESLSFSFLNKNCESRRESRLKRKLCSGQLGHRRRWWFLRLKRSTDSWRQQQEGSKDMEKSDESEDGSRMTLPRGV